jgi:hypothetical protein
MLDKRVNIQLHKQWTPWFNRSELDRCPVLVLWKANDSWFHWNERLTRSRKRIFTMSPPAILDTFLWFFQAFGISKRPASAGDESQRVVLQGIEGSKPWCQGGGNWDVKHMSVSCHWTNILVRIVRPCSGASFVMPLRYVVRLKHAMMPPIGALSKEFSSALIEWRSLNGPLDARPEVDASIHL